MNIDHAIHVVCRTLIHFLWQGAVVIAATDPAGVGAIEKPTDQVDPLRNAINNDPSFARESEEPLSQRQAIASWQLLLTDKSLPLEQQVFAWWRIGSLASYNFDSSQNEMADMALAEEALATVHEIAGDQISLETLNGATVFASLPGHPAERAERMAKSYIWLATRTDEMAQASAIKINHNGYGVDDELMPGGMRLDSGAKKREFLRNSLIEYREIITRRISVEIQYTQNPKAIETLLRTISEVAAPAQIEAWQAQLQTVLDSKTKKPSTDNGGKRNAR